MPEEIVLVTGASGFIAGHVIEELIEGGYKVRATDLPKTDFVVAKKVGAEIVPANLTDKESLRKAVKGVTYIAHLGAIYSLGAKKADLFNANIQGTKNLCEVALENNIKRFIYYATCDIYGQTKTVPVYEDERKKPENNYALSKWLGEVAAFEYYKEKGLPVTCIRPTVVYGPRGTYAASIFNTLPAILHYLGVRKFYSVKKGPEMSWVHARDLAGAVKFLLTAEGAVGNSYNVADDTFLTVKELVDELFNPYGIEHKDKLAYPKRIVGLVSRVLMKILPNFVLNSITNWLNNNWEQVIMKYNIESALKPRFDRGFLSYGTGDRTFSNKKIKDLGYKFKYPDFKQGFRETLDWYRQMKWLPSLEDIKKENEKDLKHVKLERKEIRKKWKEHKKKTKEARS